MKRFSQITVIIALFYAWPLLQAENVSLYMEPDANTGVFANEPLSVIDALKPRPWPEGQTSTEWMTVPYDGNYVGFVEPAMINKDLTVREGAAIKLRADAASPTLATAGAGVEPQVIELNEDWVTVFYEGTAPVYFKRSAEAPVVESETITVSSAQPVPQTGATEPVTTAPQGMLAPVPVAGQPAPGVDAATSGASTPPPPPPSTELFEYRPDVLPDKKLARSWEGKLIKLRGFDKWFTDYTYALEDASGKRFAYVDFKRTLLFRPIQEFEDTYVIIEGTAERKTSTIPLRIQARYIRPR